MSATRWAGGTRLDILIRAAIDARRTLAMVLREPDKAVLGRKRLEFATRKLDRALAEYSVDARRRRERRRPS